MKISEDKAAEIQVKQLEMVHAILTPLANYGATLKKLLSYSNHSYMRVCNHLAPTNVPPFTPLPWFRF
jgi:hypothetical protein